MKAASVTVVASILEEHFEELAFLWGQRLEAIRSPAWTPTTLQDLDDRIGAHVQGLMVGRHQTIPIVKEGLVAEDSSVSFAAAYTLLRLEIPQAAKIVSEAFQHAQEAQLDGIRHAICNGPIQGVLQDLKRAISMGSAPVALAGIECLVFHSLVGWEANRLGLSLTDENPKLRQVGWRINGRVGFERNQQSFETALNDNDPQIRWEAGCAAAWTQQKCLLPLCRNLTAEPTAYRWNTSLLMAILGKPEDLQRVLCLASNAELGPRRFQLLGALGHPETVEVLLNEMKNQDPRNAVAAGAAYTKLTGFDIESDERVQLSPEDGSEPDEFEKEFLDEAMLPDVRRATEHWKNAKARFSSVVRMCRGFDVSSGVPPNVLSQLDMESRWQALLRGRFEGTWEGNSMDLERFPLPVLNL